MPLPDYAVPRLLDNRYRIIRSLAEGGFGSTFLAADTRLPSERPCVVKQLRLDATTPDLQTIAKARFTREAVVLEDLGRHHHQIPQLYAYFEEAGEFYLVQEYIEGKTLTQQVKAAGAWSGTQVQTLLQQLLPVLTYIHSKGIIHRDIKPDNIILRQHDSLPVLIDFGAVKEAVRTGFSQPGQPQPSVIIGTTGFMPPEQAAGHPTISSDLYALGLTAIYSLTGRLPQDIEDNPMTGELYWQALVPTLSPRLAAVLNQVIRPIPKDRFASAQAMQRALGASAQPVAAPPPVPAPNPVPKPPISTSPTLPPVQSPQTTATRVVAQPAPAEPAPPVQTAVPKPAAATTRRGGCRWVLWVLLIVIIAGVSGSVSFVLKRRSILFFSNGDNGEVINPAVLSPDAAKAVVEDFYRYVSAGDMDQTRTLVGGTLAEQLDPNGTFFQQFDRVSVERLTVTDQTDSTINLTGFNTYYYPDGTTQEEERTFTVEMMGTDPRLVASEFVRVSRPRQ